MHLADKVYNSNQYCKAGQEERQTATCHFIVCTCVTCGWRYDHSVTAACSVVQKADVDASKPVSVVLSHFSPSREWESL